MGDKGCPELSRIVTRSISCAAGHIGTIVGLRFDYAYAQGPVSLHPSLRASPWRPYFFLFERSHYGTIRDTFAQQRRTDYADIRRFGRQRGGAMTQWGTVYLVCALLVA